MGENDMLKRDLNIERLRAEESNQAAKMAEAKMEALTSEYETRLHDATVNKTLLKRRERQVADYKAQVESEKQKTAAAVESEREWRDVMEKCKVECKEKVDEAQLYAALMEGRNTAMTSHWADQGAEVDRSVAKLGKRINTIIQERKKDDAKIDMLKSLCDQQAEQLRLLELEKQGINDAFEAYKKQQEDMLKDIKTKAAAQEKDNEEILKESRRVLGELKWALGVNKNVKGAQ
jgi:chromosome segregation ATPase